MTSRTFPAQDVCGGQPSGSQPRSSARTAGEKPLARAIRSPAALCWAPGGNTHEQAQAKPLTRSTPADIVTFTRASLDGRLSIYDRTVPAADREKHKPLLTVSDSQARSLNARGLIEFKGRRVITHAVLRNGVAMAAVKAALREHITHSVPVAEDNRTVRRVGVAGCGVYHEPIHVGEWDDGRSLNCNCTIGRVSRLTRGGNGNE